MKKYSLPFVLSIILLGIIAYVLYIRFTRYEKIVGAAQGTTYHITYQTRLGKSLQRSIDSILKDFDHSLSTYDPSSNLSRLNQNDPQAKPDAYFNRVFNVSQEVWNATDGAFDITIAPIVNAYGFGSGKQMDIDSARIDSLLQYVGMDKVKLVDGILQKSDPAITMNVNAIAQGYSVDVVAEFLESRNISNYMVEIGGELRSKGKNPSGKKWRIGIDKPEEGNFVAGHNLQAILSISGKSLATSGNYRKYYEKDGLKYVHTIDPQTGYPVMSRLLSATIVSEECIYADAYATACMVLGLEKSKQLLKEHPELRAYLIYSDSIGGFNVFVTPGMDSLLVQ